MGHVIGQGRVITPDGVVSGEVCTDAGRIIEVRPVDDVPEQWVCPGFIDLQINGTHGIDVGAAPERIGEMAERLPGEGTTAFLPTVITCDEPRRSRAITAAAGGWSGAGTPRAEPLGLHLEGPVISSARRGAHPARHLAGAASVAGEDWSPDSGVVMVTLAPELPGALELIAELTSAGVVVALGHTDATAEEFQAGLDAGATHVTHLFNAMRPFGHRDPGPIGVVLADDTVTAGLICDGLHVDPVAVRMAWRALGADRLTLVTDAVAARGTRPLRDGIRTAEGVLAGSAITLDVALRNLIAATGARVAEAVATVTSTPARVLGLHDRGVITPGARADVTVLDRELRVLETHVAGVRIG